MQGQLDSGELIAEAEQQFAAGDFSTAIINLKNVVSRDKTDARARFLLGRAYIESLLLSKDNAAAGHELQREQGLDLLRKVLEIAPINPDIAYHLASALSDSGQSNAARKQLQSILSQHGEFPFRKEAELLLSRIDDE